VVWGAGEKIPRLPDWPNQGYLPAHIAMAPLRCLSLFYNGLADWRQGDLRDPPRPRSVPLATKAPLGSTTPLGRSAGRAVWPQRSGGQAATFGTGASESVRSELRSNSRAMPGEIGTRAARLTIAAPGNHSCDSAFVGSEDAMPLLTFKSFDDFDNTHNHNGNANARRC
jgi:hypothetical protein